MSAFSDACDAYVAAGGAFQRSTSLHVSPIRSAPGLWEMTWTFSGPDGRTTFEFLLEAGGHVAR